MTRLLMIDDDEKLVALLGEYLHPQGFELDVAYDGPSGLAAARDDQPALVILDLMLPGLDGLEVCRRLRQTSRVPVLMLTARGDETDRIVGLEMGADDYLPKPFSPRELLARVRAILRRTGGSGESSGQEAGQGGDGAGASARVVVGPVTIDPPARRVTLGGREVDLTTAEFDLFHALARCAGRVLSRDDLLQQVHGPGWAAYSRSVDVHISRIRQKVEVDARQPVLLKTVRGVGYMLCRLEANDGHLEVPA
jgi:two-component system response regulator CpxR